MEDRRPARTVGAMTRAAATFAVVVGTLGAMGCGGAGTSPSPRQGSATSRGSTAAPSPASTMDDADMDSDSRAKRFDRDDREILGYGNAASKKDTRTIERLVARYYRAAAAADGGTACMLTFRPLAKAIPEDEGTPGYGPAYLRGLKTCPAILTAYFKHERYALASPVEVVGVRVKGGKGDVFLASKRMPMSLTEVTHEDGTWKVDRFTRAPLP